MHHIDKSATATTFGKLVQKKFENVKHQKKNIWSNTGKEISNELLLRA